MSMSSESLNLHHKCIATNHVMNNEDPLVTRKKAHQVVQPNKTVTTVTIVAPAPKNGINISLHLVLRHISD